MKKNKREKIFAAVILLSLAFCVVSNGAVGTDDDPLISLSYITNVVMPYIDNAVSSASASGFSVVEVPDGKSLSAGEGTELILRSGEGTVLLSKSASGGFTDVTDGRDVGDGEKVSSNHHLICPRSDGRSIKAKGTVYMMVKGVYEIK